MAERAAALLPEHSYVNLGLGIPTLVSNYLGGRDIILHGENGILGYGGYGHRATPSTTTSSTPAASTSPPARRGRTSTA